jgi:hypothetical protein
MQVEGVLVQFEDTPKAFANCSPGLQVEGVLVQFEHTPKAFANCSPGLLQPWVQGQDRPNAESVR